MNNELLAPLLQAYSSVATFVISVFIFFSSGAYPFKTAISSLISFVICISVYFKPLLCNGGA